MDEMPAVAVLVVASGASDSTVSELAEAAATLLGVGAQGEGGAERRMEQHRR